MAPPQLGGQRDGNDRGELRPAEVVDVVVLGDHEALPLALRERVDGAVELQKNRSPLEGQLGRIGVGDVDRPRRVGGWPVPEAPSVRPGSDVRDDVDLLPFVLECALEGEVVVRRHDQLVGCSVLAQACREACEEAVERAGLHGSLESRVQFVVQRTGPLHRRDVLRDTREVDGSVVRDSEKRGQMLRELAGAVETDDGHDGSGEQSLEDLGVDVLVAVPPAPQTCLLPQDRAVQSP